ncbi:MAG: energy transducer TonB [Gemmatimonadota bacterium]
MFDLLQHPSHSPEPVHVGATVSIVTHAALVLSLALGTGQAVVSSQGAGESIMEMAIRYLLPPNKQGAPSDATRAQWTSQQPGPVQPPSSAVDNGTRAPKETGADASTEVEESAPLPLAEAASAQNAFTLMDLDSAAVRDPESAAPLYPALLQAQGIEGMAIVRFVVDSTGRADLSSFRLIESSHPLFAAAVRDALPRMKFRAAIIGSRKVRQLVEQPFIFRIVRPGTSPPVKEP